MASSRSLGTLSLDVIAKVGGFTEGMDKAARAADSRSKQINASFGKMKGVIAGAFAGVAAGFSLREVVAATAEAETSLAALKVAVDNNAGAAGKTTEQLVDMSSALQSTTTYSDETIQGMQALLLSFKQIDATNFDNTQQAVLDLATALKTDLPSAAKLVGRALADPEKGMTALSRAGVVLSDSQKELIKRLAETGKLSEAQAILLEQLEGRFGGAAKAARDNFGGALIGLKNAFGDLLEVKAGLPGAVDSLNELTKVLQDPKTKAAADTLFSGLISGGAYAVKVLAETVEGVKSDAEKIAALFNGAASDDIEGLKKQRDQILSFIENPTERVRFFGKDGVVKWYSKEELANELADVDRQIKAFSETAKPIIPVSTSTIGPASSAPPSEEFTKLKANLDEQIALYGKTGQAAKLAYEIQIGAYEDLTTAEGESLLVLARRADAQAAATEAQKKAADEAKKQADAIVAAQKGMDDLVTSLEQQVATYGKSEDAVIEYRLTYGDLKTQLGLTGAEAEKYKATIIDLTKRQKEATLAAQHQQELESDAASIYESTRTPLENYIHNMERLDELRNSQSTAGAPLIDEDTLKRAQDAMQNNNYDDLLNGLGVYKEETQKSYEDMYAAVDEARQNDLISEQQAADARIAIGKMERDSRLEAAQTLFGGLSSLMSSHNRKAFEIGKAAAIANATVSAGQAIANAYATQPWYLGLAQGVAAASILYSQIDQIKSVQFQGYQTGGYTGNGGVSDVAGVVHGREFVMNAAATSRIGVGNLEALQRGEVMQGGTNVTVENYGTPQTYERKQGISPDEVRLIARDVVASDTPRVFAAHMKDANSVISQSVTRNTQAPRRR